MAAYSSMQYTIGTALERARERGLLVEVLVDGHWLEGLVVASDGHGIVLENGGDDHCVIRLERVAVVRVGARAPRLGIVDGTHSGERDARFEGAMPMPGPRAAAV
ncbi:MAG TPA: hypothetical protein VHO29_03850 [Marmoricola sp.]|nr:hypothetical protein [Marmoricola sp.]